MSVYPQEIIGEMMKNQSLDIFQPKQTKKQIEELEEEKKKCTLINKLMENIIFQIVITLFTIISLFIEDIRVIFIPKEYDTIVDMVNVGFIVLFSTEIFMSLTISGYFCSFFFFLDILSTFSIVLDISLITDLLYNTNGSDGFQLNILITQSKASRAAARAVRVMKIFRLTRVVKLYKSALRTKQLKEKSLIKKQKLRDRQLKKLEEAINMEERENQSKSHQSQSAKNIKNKFENLKIFQEEESPEEIKNVQSGFSQRTEINKGESKIGKLLSQSTMKKVIIVILFLMFSVPIFDIDNYYPESSSWDFLVGFVGKALLKQSISLEKISSTIHKNIATTKQLEIYSELIIFKTPFSSLPSYNLQSFEDLRLTDIGISEYEVNIGKIIKVRPDIVTNENEASITIIINYYNFNKLDSIFSIIKIIFICLIIMYLLNSFNEHTNELIIEPIEKMVEQIKTKGEPDTVDEEKQEKQKNNYETTLVHNAITKISSLMLKVFGSMAFQNIYKKIFNSGTIIDNYLSESQRSYCIFGLCTIEEYEALASILKEDIFQLTNDVAKYLHSAVFRYGGSGVVNYGKKFLVVFPLPPQAEKETPLDKKGSRKFNVQDFNIQADFSIYSMVKTFVKINKQHEFIRYKKDSKLVSSLGESFQIKINCVLHAGWAYGGLIGSAYKIDPAYIGQPILELEAISQFCMSISNSLFLTCEVQKLITSELKKMIRKVDIFQVGQLPSSKQIQLYRVEMDLQNISPPKTAIEKRLLNREEIDVGLKKELNLQFMRNEKLKENYRANYVVNSRKQLREVLKNAMREDYRQKYESAFLHFINENWSQAKQILEELFLQNKQDPLTCRLIRIIQQHHNNPGERPRPSSQQINLFDY